MLKSQNSLCFTIAISLKNGFSYWISLQKCSTSKNPCLGCLLVHRHVYYIPFLPPVPPSVQAVIAKQLNRKNKTKTPPPHIHTKVNWPLIRVVVVLYKNHCLLLRNKIHTSVHAITQFLKTRIVIACTKVWILFVCEDDKAFHWLLKCLKPNHF